MSYHKTPYKIKITTEAAELVDPGTPAGINLKARIIRNLSTSVSVWLGASDVTADSSKGFELKPGSDFPDSLSNGKMYAVVASGTADVQVWEVIN